MSRTLGLLLTREAAYAAGPGARDVVRLPWAADAPDAPDALVEALRHRFPRVDALVVAVGSEFLEVARPDVPALPPRVRWQVLQRASDRYFAVAGAVAISAPAGPFAFALPSDRLAAWVRPLDRWAPVRGVVAEPVVAARMVPDGTVALPVGPARHLLLESAGMTFRSVRFAAPPDGEDAGRVQVDGLGRPSHPHPLAPEAIARAAAAFLDADRGELLLDEAEARRVERWRRWQLVRAVSALAAAAVLAAWTLDRQRERTLAALTRAGATLATDAGAALALRDRLGTAEREAALLGAPTPRTPIASLARLGALLPPDAVVQRLEWDGRAWRLDGSAARAADLVPRLDADPLFDAVRLREASTRYVEAGRARESFAIEFVTNAGAGGDGRTGRDGPRGR